MCLIVSLSECVLCFVLHCVLLAYFIFWLACLFACLVVCVYLHLRTWSRVWPNSLQTINIKSTFQGRLAVRDRLCGTNARLSLRD